MLRRSLLAIVVGFSLPVMAGGSNSLSLLSYNLENLFDTEHDKGKNDWQFLPSNFPGKTQYCNKLGNKFEIDRCLENDWTADKLQIKLSQIKRVVDSVGDLPDMLAVVEVENENVVKMLATTLGYKNWLVTDSPDERGIDVALLYNESSGFKMTSHREHDVSKVAGKPTRNILEVNFSVPGNQTLTVFVNHWPSQSAPAPVRVAVAEALMTILEKKQSSSPKNRVIVAGDFNVIGTDRPDPFYDSLQKPGRKEVLVDIDTEYRKQAKNFGVKVATIPLGTYFFVTGVSWNLLDHFFVSPNMMGNGLSIDLSSYKIISPNFAIRSFDYKLPGEFLAGTTISRIPHQYNHNSSSPSSAGFSDHFPIFVKLKF